MARFTALVATAVFTLPAALGSPSVDECTLAETNICDQAGQVCYDPDQSTSDNWRCECKAPYSPSGPTPPKTVADCSRVDECEDLLKAGVCLDAKPAQFCRDPNDMPDSLDDWECVCAWGGKNTTAPVFYCGVDECEADCPTCEMDACARSYQTCEDPVMTEQSLGDWVCMCPPPVLGVQRGLPVDSCELDECDAKFIAGDIPGMGGVECSFCELDRCSQAGQTCVDPDTHPAAIEDWYCKCAPPSDQTAVGGRVPACHYDECETDAEAVNCSVVQPNAACYDPDHTRANDWECDCTPPYFALPGYVLPEPSKPGATSRYPKCGFDECGGPAGDVCSAAGQICEDPSPSSLSDWLCGCPPPTVTTTEGMQAPATCEGAPGASLCASGAAAWETCTNAGQVCREDSNTAEWWCECLPPYTTEKMSGGVAACKLNECTEVCSTCNQQQAFTYPLCETYMQECMDPDLTVRGDWECTCQDPMHGMAAKPMTVAECFLDECEASCPSCEADMCALFSQPAEVQTCHDPNHATWSLRDWECRCPFPSSVVHTNGPVPYCTVDECSLEEVRNICGTLDQDCVDPDGKIDNDWECHCKAPGVGVGAQQVARVCVLDECVEACKTCMRKATGGVDSCAAQGQVCKDADLETLGDWECVDGPTATPTSGVPASGSPQTAMPSKIRVTPTPPSMETIAPSTNVPVTNVPVPATDAPQVPATNSPAVPATSKPAAGTMQPATTAVPTPVVPVTSAPAGITASPSSDAGAEGSDSDDGGLSVGVLIAIIAGAVLLLAVCIFVLRKRSAQDDALVLNDDQFHVQNSFRLLDVQDDDVRSDNELATPRGKAASPHPAGYVSPVMSQQLVPDPLDVASSPASLSPRQNDIKPPSRRTSVTPSDDEVVPVDL